MAAIRFSLSVHFIVTAQTRLECFGAFIVYMSTVSKVSITFDRVQFVSRQSRVYTCISIYAGIGYKTLVNPGWLSILCAFRYPPLINRMSYSGMRTYPARMPTESGYLHTTS